MTTASASAKTPSDRLRVGVLGVGYPGWIASAPVISAAAMSRATFR